MSNEGALIYGTCPWCGATITEDDCVDPPNDKFECPSCGIWHIISQLDLIDNEPIGGGNCTLTWVVCADHVKHVFAVSQSGKSNRVSACGEMYHPDIKPLKNNPQQMALLLVCGVCEEFERRELLQCPS